MRRTFEVNTLGQIWMVQSILPLLKQSQPEEGGALVVSVASVVIRTASGLQQKAMHLAAEAACCLSGERD